LDGDQVVDHKFRALIVDPKRRAFRGKLYNTVIRVRIYLKGAKCTLPKISSSSAICGTNGRNKIHYAMHFDKHRSGGHKKILNNFTKRPDNFFV
jgi:hypothetical protein